ncbi:MAG: hypothetical protein AB1773_05875 [Pseudomonadota bacterium]
MKHPEALSRPRLALLDLAALVAAAACVAAATGLAAAGVVLLLA